MKIPRISCYVSFRGGDICMIENDGDDKDSESFKNEHFNAYFEEDVK